MIHVGVDLHQGFCYVTVMDARGKILQQRAVSTEAGELRRWAGSLPGPAQVVMEACSFWPGFQKSLSGEVAKMVLVHPARVKAIAAAGLKNDRVDSEMLAHLSRCGLLPEAWMADEGTRQARQRTRLRVALGRQRARAKNLLQAVLHQEGQQKPVTDLFGKRGRAWLEEVRLSAAGRESVATYCELIDHYDRVIGERQKGLEQAGSESAEARWLATIPGIGLYLAMVILAEIGDIRRFSDKKALCNYAGLVPRVRESAGKRQAGGLTYQGSKLLRWAMIQAAHGATRSSPAVWAWYEKRRQRKRPQVARVALARKLLTCVWALLRHGVGFEESVFATG
jgi:transposase